MNQFYTFTMVLTLFFALSVTSVNANQPAFGDMSDEETDIEDDFGDEADDSQDDSGDDEDIYSTFFDAIDNLDSVQIDLQDGPKITKLTSDKIKNAVAILEGLNEEPDKCVIEFNRAINIINSSVKQLEKRMCKAKPNKHCISEDILSEDLPFLKDTVETLQEVISVDDDDDGIVDVCSGE